MKQKEWILCLGTSSAYTYGKSNR